jgi:hypothetical protein
MQAYVPPEKMQKARGMIAAELASLSHTTRKRLQQAMGYLNHLAQVVWSARTHLRRLIDLVYVGDGKRIALTTGARSDLAFWAMLAEKHNGSAVLLQNRC